MDCTLNFKKVFLKQMVFTSKSLGFSSKTFLISLQCQRRLLQPRVFLDQFKKINVKYYDTLIYYLLFLLTIHSYLLLFKLFTSFMNFSLSLNYLKVLPCCCEWYLRIAWWYLQHPALSLNLFYWVYLSFCVLQTSQNL